MPWTQWQEWNRRGISNGGRYVVWRFQSVVNILWLLFIAAVAMVAVVEYCWSIVCREAYTYFVKMAMGYVAAALCPNPNSSVYHNM